MYENFHFHLIAKQFSVASEVKHSFFSLDLLYTITMYNGRTKLTYRRVALWLHKATRLRCSRECDHDSREWFEPCRISSNCFAFNCRAISNSNYKSVVDLEPPYSHIFLSACFPFSLPFSVSLSLFAESQPRGTRHLPLGCVMLKAYTNWNRS